MNRKFLWLLSILLIVTVACSFTGGRSTNEPQPQVEITAVVDEQPTVEPPPMDEPAQESELPPTEEVVQEEQTQADGQDYTEEFDGDTSSWRSWVVAGDASKNFTEIKPGAVTISLPASETYSYFANESFEYEDVYVEARMTAKVYGDNGMAVACRISEDGWYELRVHTTGIYAGSFELYRFDQLLRNEKKNPYVNVLNNIPRINSVDILNGSKPNIIGLSCVGDTLTPIINGVAQKQPKDVPITDNYLSSGQIGVGAMSFSNGKVEVEVDYVTVESR